MKREGSYIPKAELCLGDSQLATWDNIKALHTVGDENPILVDDPYASAQGLLSRLATAVEDQMQLSRKDIGVLATLASSGE